MKTQLTPTKLDRQVCLSCKNQFKGKYCNVCGEKIIEDHERKVKYFLGNLINAFTFADSKFIKSFKSIIVNPGQLSEDWVRGKRVQWMRPLSMFFLLNFIYFLVPLLQTFNTPYAYQVDHQRYSEWAMRKAKEKASTLSISMEELQTQFDAQSPNIAKLLIIAFVILISFLLAICFLLSKRYYSDHLTFALEWGSFNLLVNTIILGFLLIPISHIISMLDATNLNLINDTSITSLSLLFNCYFIYKAGKRFYNLKGIQSWGFVLMSVLILGLALNLYRALLFFVVILSL